MNIHILSVGNKMPAWVTQGCEDYLKRFSPEIKCKLIEIPLPNRNTVPVAKAIEQEGNKMLTYLEPHHHVVALAIQGQAWSNENLAQQLKQWLQNGHDICLLIGGPDGLASSCLRRAQQQWSLSNLTLPHPLVRIIVLEQLYRAWSILKNHPYHRA